MMYDPGSSINLLSLRAFEQMQIPRSLLSPSVGFLGVSGTEMEPLGKVALPVTFGGPDNFRTETLVFDVTDTPQPYNGLLGRPAIRKFASLYHGLYNIVKISGPNGVISLHGELKDAVCCLQIEAKKAAAASATVAALTPSGVAAPTTTGSSSPTRPSASGKESEKCETDLSGKKHSKLCSKRDGEAAPPTTKKVKASQLAPAAETKQVPISEDGSHTVSIGVGLSDK